MSGETPRLHKTVLVADDDPDAQIIYRLALEHAGYDVRVAVNGAEALEAITADPPDVVLLDFAMPKLSGPEVFAQLRANPATRDVPVIACTAIVIAAEAPALRAMGYADVLLKPLDPAVLRSAVDRICRRGRE